VCNTPLLAAAYGRVGRIEEGLRIVAEALAKGDSSGAGEVELYRVKGELILRQRIPDAPEAEICFRQALDIARRQQAKSLELRAAVSLARLWQRHGKCAEARALLAPIYGWFTGASTLPVSATRGSCWTSSPQYRSEIGMRPLVAHCHLGLGKLYQRTGKPDRQRSENPPSY
jgi:tetratricopeptide (TPR) repeat protein